MIFVNLARLHVAVEPTVDGLESDAQLFSELGLAKFAFKSVGIESINQVLWHGALIL